jgi:phosphatidylglycerol:prolipoprotein diacylglycerol transferase
MILIHPISPVAINLFGLQIRWYAIAYIMAFVIGLWLMKKISPVKGKKYWDDLLTYVILGVIIGGRLGYVLFYNLHFFLQHPLEIFAIWHGGMSFHGGLAGVIAAVFIFAKKDTFHILDKISIVAPIGLFFGRIANFINMEVMGRITDKPWGVVFEGSNELPRHPSPLYEAGLEGIVLFIIMWSLRNSKKTGFLSGVFAILYGSFRIFCEQFREPDTQLGFLFGTDWLTMGMTLSIIMIIIGICLIFRKKSVRIP